MSNSLEPSNPSGPAPDPDKQQPPPTVALSGSLSETTLPRDLYRNDRTGLISSPTPLADMERNTYSMSGPILAAQLNDNGDSILIATGHRVNEFRLEDLSSKENESPSGKLKIDYEALGISEGMEITAACYAGPGKRTQIVASYKGGNLLVVPLNGEAPYKIQLEGEVTCLAGSREGLLAIGIESPDGNRVEVRSHENNYQAALSQRKYERTPVVVNFGQQGRKLLVATPARVQLLDPESEDLRVSTTLIQSSDATILSASFAPGGLSVAVGAKEGHLYLFDLSETVSMRLKKMADDVTALRYTSKGRHLAVGMKGPMLEVLDTRPESAVTVKELSLAGNIFFSNKKPVLSLRFSPDERSLLLAAGKEVVVVTSKKEQTSGVSSDSIPPMPA